MTVDRAADIAPSSLLELPAVDPADAGAFAEPSLLGERQTEEPDGPKAPARNYRRVVLAVLKGLDRALSIALRVPQTTGPDLDAYAEAISPAAEAYGAKLGGAFWAIVAACGFSAFILGKLFQRAMLNRKGHIESGEGDSSDGRAGRTAGNAGRNGGESPAPPRGRAIYPEGYDG